MTAPNNGTAPSGSERERRASRKELLRFGLSALRYGASLFTLKKGDKVPTAEGWTKIAGLDDSGLRSAVAAGFNIGTRGGELRGGGGLAIIDIDHADPNDPLAALRVLGLLTPDGKHATLTVRTGREGGTGLHAYFRTPSPVPTNNKLELAPGLVVEVKAAKTFVVAAGSIHPSGNAYTIHPDSVAAGSDDPFGFVADAPAELLRLLEPQRPKIATDSTYRPNVETASVRLRGALRSAFDSIARSREGERNNTIASAAFFVGTVAAHADATERDDARAELIRAAVARCGDEVEKAGETAGRSFDDGLKSPAPDRPWPNGTAPEGEGDHGHSSPTIHLVSGELPRVVEEAIAVLRKIGVYQRGGALVRVVRDAEQGAGRAAKRPEGAPVIVPVEIDWLRSEIGRVVSFERFDSTHGKAAPRDCPVEVARAVMAQRGRWNVPVLVGVTETPPLRPDGSIRIRPGFDPETGLLFDPCGADFSNLPEQPTQQDARYAVARIRDLVRDFPFDGPAHFAAWLALPLTVVARHLFDVSPLFVIGAARRGSGKSMLARIAAIFATGREPAFFFPTQTDEEDRKRLVTIAIEGDPLVVLDNVSTLGGGPLDMAITTGRVGDRLLGVNKNARPSFRAVLAATGNNIVYRGDIFRRIVPSRLRSDDERPEERDPLSFRVPDIVRHVIEARAVYVEACLVIVAAYLRAARPKQTVRPFGGFEQWRELIPAAIVFAGSADPLEARDDIPEEADASEHETRILVVAIVEAMGERPFNVAELVKKAGTEGPLFDALSDAAPAKEGPGIDAKALGKRLQRLNGAVCDGRSIVPAMRDGKREMRDRRSLWRARFVRRAEENENRSETPRDGKGNAGSAPLAPCVNPSENLNQVQVEAGD